MAVELPPGTNLNIRIARFFTKAKEEIVREPKQVAVPDGHGNLVMQEIINYRKTGKMVTEDWVSYGPPGQLDRSQTPVKISMLQKVMPPQGEYHPAAQAQYEMAQMVLKHYEMWQKGQELPIDGTPLAAWNGLTHEEVEEFHKRGIRTVEEIRDMTDALIAKLNVPRIREKKAMAQRFLDAADHNRVAAEREADREEVKSLQEQVAQLTQALAASGKGKPQKQPGKEQ